jgi:CubicO group peptidase (beta-lactamase class C family)
MIAKGATGFVVAAGKGGREVSRVRVGDIGVDAQLPIASASKWLTAATVLAVVDEGKLSLDAPISTWLPTVQGEAASLTIRQLLSQTSGLAGSVADLYDLRQDARITLAQSAQEVTARPLAHRPGQVFVYGGPGFQVAGAVVEAVTGKRWNQIFEEKIARPLGMGHTYWTHLRFDAPMQPPDADTLNPVLQGGAVSTAGDYMRFLGMLARGGVYEGKRILSRKSVRAMLSDQTTSATMTPTGAGVLESAHYGLGNWCETWDSRGRCDRSSSIGAFGAYPWLEQKSGRFGIVFIYLQENAFRVWPEMQAIRDAM